MHRLVFGILLVAAVVGAGKCLIAQDQPQANYRTVPITITMEAGSGQFHARPEGGEVHHAGIGYLDPYGPASYSCGLNYPEAKRFPAPDYFTPSFHKAYEIDGFIFCVYTVKDGSLYAYDGVAGRISTTSEARKDEIVNIIVGGTGAFQGATGLWVGQTQGQGKVSEVAPGRKLPESILKLMNGYVRLPGE
jgi:hypothetical protein